MSPFIVKTVFAGKDLLSPIFKRQSAAAGKFGDKASRSFAKASRSATSFGSVVKGILTAGLIQRGLSVVAMGVRGATEEFVDFDQALTQAGAKFPTVIKRGTESFNQLGTVARKVGAETQFSAADAARGLDFLAMAGFNAEQSMAALPGITDLATIANTDLARSTDIASDALGAFNLMSKDSAQLEKNLTRVTDVMAATVTSANTDMELLFETMKMAGPVATNAGASIETFNTFAAEMANAGIKGTLAGTALRTAFINLAAPTAGAKKWLKKLKVEIKDSNGNMRDMMDIIDDVRKGTSKMGNVQKTAALNAIFGKRAIAGMSVVLNASSEQLRDYRKKLEGAAGASKRMATDIRKSIGNRLKELRSALIEIGFKFLEAFVGKGEGALDRLIVAIRNFNVRPIVEGVKTIMNVISVAADGIKIFAETFRDLWPVIKWTGILVGGLKVAVWALNAAMLANPIGALIAVIGILIATLVTLSNKWNSVKATMSLVWVFIKNTFISIFESVQKAAITFANTIIGAFNKVFALFGDFRVEEFKLPDESANIQRQIELVKARNNLLAAAVKDSEELQQKALAVDKSMHGQQQKAIHQRQAEIEFAPFGGPQSLVSGPRQAETGYASFETPSRSVDPELIRQQIGFQGEINLRGAPEGTSFTGKTKGAPPIKTEVLGANP